MNNGDLQFAADVLLIDKISTIDIAISKQAGIADEVINMAKSGALALKKEVEERVKTEGIFSVFTYYFMAKSGWLMKMAMLLAEEIGGISIGGILNSVWNALRGTVKGEEQISPQKVNQVVKNAVQENITVTAQVPNDMLYDLRKIESEGGIVRLAGRGNFVLRLLRALDPTRARWMVGGFIAMFVKTILWGVGLLTMGGVAKKLITGDDDEDDEKEEEGTPVGSGYFEKSKPKRKVTPLSWVPPIVPHAMKESGMGITHFINDGTTKIWSIPLKTNLRNTMIMWAESIYPDLKGKGNLIATTPAFNIMVSNLNKYVEQSGYFITIPPNFHSIKEIVDHFVGQTARKLERETNETAQI